MQYQVEFRRYQRQFRQPLVTAHGVWRDRHGIILRLTDSAGRVGYGEIAPLEWFGTETLDQAWEFCQGLSGRLKSSEPNDSRSRESRSRESRSSESESSESESSESESSELKPGAPSTAASFTISSTLPACQFGFEAAVSGAQLGARSQLDAIDRPPFTSLPHSALLPTGAAALQAWQPLWEQGTRTFKWKIGVASIQTELRELTQLLQQLPNTVQHTAQLRLDANGGLTWNTACRWLEVCADYPQIEFLEQPLPVGALDEMLELSDRYPTPLALDESVATLLQLEQCYQRGWRGIFVVKPAIAGSPARLRQFCQQPQVDVVWSSVFETAIARRYIEGHLVPGLVPFMSQQRPLGFGTRHWFTDDTLDQPDPEQLWQTL